jgi:hypothetical protein
MTKPISNGPIPPASPAKQLILRLAGELARLHDSQPSTLDLIAEARAYLDQPEPEEPTDEELLVCMLKAAASVPGGQCTGILDWDKEAIAAARAVLARWGFPAAEPEVPTDEELLAAQDQAVASFPPIHPEAEPLSAAEYARELEIRKGRAVLARWGK